MKLYHIDRSGKLKENVKIDLIKDIELNKPFLKKESYKIQELYKEGLSSHGLHYYLNALNNHSAGLDVVFEYERRLNYPEKLSRFQSFYAFDLESALEFIKSKDLNFEYYKIYEIDYDYYERHNMNLIRGWANFDISISAKYYWEDLDDYYEDKKPIYEYLVKLPIILKKEIKYEDLVKELESKKNDK